MQLNNNDESQLGSLENKRFVSFELVDKIAKEVKNAQPKEEVKVDSEKPSLEKIGETIRQQLLRAQKVKESFQLKDGVEKQDAKETVERISEKIKEHAERWQKKAETIRQNSVPIDEKVQSRIELMRNGIAARNWQFLNKAFKASQAENKA